MLNVLYMYIDWLIKVLLGMRSTPVSETYRGITCDGIIYYRVAKYRPQHFT